MKMFCNTKTNNSRRRGFTLVEIMIVIAIIAIVASIIMYNMSKARAQAKLSQCVQNLRAIAAGVEMCKTEYPDLFGVSQNQTRDIVIDQDCFLVEKGFLKSVPMCPNGSNYNLVVGGFKHDTSGQNSSSGQTKDKLYYHISHVQKDCHKDCGLNGWNPYYRSGYGITYHDNYN